MLTHLQLLQTLLGIPFLASCYSDHHKIDSERIQIYGIYPHLAYCNNEGAHGKGLYSGQGVMVYSNNGETG